MRNKFTKLMISALLCGSMILSSVSLTSCNLISSGNSGSGNPGGNSSSSSVGKTYTVLFGRNCEDNVEEPEIEVKEGETVTPPTVERRGYEVEGWYLDEACTQKFDFSTPIVEDLTLYAHWVTAVTRYKVSFNLNGAEGNIDTQTIVTGEKAEKPADPSRGENYKFLGWYMDAAGTMPFNFDNAITTNFDLYAKWAEIYTVTFHMNYDGSTEQSQKVVSGETLKAVTPEREGYVFAGWFIDAACTQAYVVGGVTSSFTLYAKWASAQAEKYTYTFNLNYEGAPAALVVEVVEGGIVEVPACEAPEGKILSGWYTDAACTQAFDVTAAATASQTLYAKWVDSITVSYNYNFDGAPEAGTVTLAAGGKVTKPSDPVRSGYTFVGWSTAANKEANFNFDNAINESVTLYAQWSTLYVFEAEDLDFSDFQSFGFSGNAIGTDAIIQDDSGAGASNGYYTWQLNNTGITLDFEFTSDREVKGVEFSIRLSAEIKDITLVSSGDFNTEAVFEILVNKNPLDYGKIELKDVPPQGSNEVKPFADYTYKVDLKEGVNHIQLVVNNSLGQGGTMVATAPMVDCIKLQTSAVLVFVPVEGNY